MVIKNTARMFLLIGWLLVTLSSANAQTVSNISFIDLDGDGDPDLAKIDFVTSRGKTVIKGDALVYDEDDDMDNLQDWRKCCDFDSDVWIFDVGGDGSAELVIDFERKEGKQFAYLYDDTSGDKKVEYAYNSTKFEIKENNFWSLSVVADDGFWMDEKGNINFNIKILGDGPISIGIPFPGTGGVTDGKLEFVVTSYDVDRDFDPDFELREGRTNQITVDGDDSEPIWDDYVFWPYLGYGCGWERGYNSACPPIQVNWKKAKISAINEIITARGDDGNYFIQTAKKIKRNEINYLDFENPYCFNDLAGDNDGIPEAVLRMSPRFDGEGSGGGNYNWDLDNNGRLDFAVRGSGKGREYTYTVGEDNVEIVDFQDFSVVTLPCDKAPYWLFDKKMQEGSYVESHGLFPIGEGMGHGMAGGIPQIIGFKVERAPQLNDELRLYLSPIDKELHLAGAKEGMFLLSSVKTGSYMGSEFSRKEYKTGNISLLSAIVYKNLDGDKYIDQWTWIMNGIPARHLIYSNEYLIYSGKEGIKIKKTKIEPAILETPPPRNSSEVGSFRKNLESHGWKFLDLLPHRRMDKDRVVSFGKAVSYLTDFNSMFNRFPGEPALIRGADLLDFRMDKDEFSFLFDCKGICNVEPQGVVKLQRALKPGKHILKYDGDFKLLAYTKPDLTIFPSEVSLIEDPKTKNIFNLSIMVRNEGGETAKSVSLNLYRGNPAAGGKFIRNITIPEIPFYGKEPVTFPLRANRDEVEIYIEVDPENAISEDDEGNNLVAVPVSFPSRMLPVGERLTIGVGENLVFVVIVFFGLMGLAFLIAVLIFR